MGEKLKLCLIGIVFLSLLVTSACVSKSAYDEVQAKLVQTQQEKARVQEDLTQEQGKASNLTSQLDAAKAEVSKLKNPVKPTLRLVRTTSEITTGGRYTEKVSFTRGDTLIVVFTGFIPVHENNYRYTGQLQVQNQTTKNIVNLQTGRWQGEALPGVSSASRIGWWTLSTSGWEAGQYIAAVLLEDDFTYARSEVALTTFTIR